MDDVPDVPSNEGDQLSPADLDRMAANVRWLKEHGHLRMREPVVTREQAVEVATDVAETMGRTLGETVDLEDVRARGARLPSVYGVGLSDCWIAYLTPLGVALRASDVIIIDKTTGGVRYGGSARDDG